MNGMAGNDEDEPDDFRCPITHEIMTDPVVATDGHTYERNAIQDWFRAHNTSPYTGAVLDDRRLVPNISLRRFINEWPEKRVS